MGVLADGFESLDETGHLEVLEGDLVDLDIVPALYESHVFALGSKYRKVLVEHLLLRRLLFHRIYILLATYCIHIFATQILHTFLLINPFPIVFLLLIHQPKCLFFLYFFLSVIFKCLFIEIFMIYRLLGVWIVINKSIKLITI